MESGEERLTGASKPALLHAESAMLLAVLDAVWRKLVGVEPTRGAVRRRTLVLKTRPSTGQD